MHGCVDVQAAESLTEFDERRNKVRFKLIEHNRCAVGRLDFKCQRPAQRQMISATSASKRTLIDDVPGSGPHSTRARARWRCRSRCPPRSIAAHIAASARERELEERRPNSRTHTLRENRSAA